MHVTSNDVRKIAEDSLKNMSALIRVQLICSFSIGKVLPRIGHEDPKGE